MTPKQIAARLREGFTQTMTIPVQIDSKLIVIGQWYRAHFSRRVTEVGVYAAAKQLRKQGVPLDVALLILVR